MLILYFSQLRYKEIEFLSDVRKYCERYLQVQGPLNVECNKSSDPDVQMEIRN